MLSFFIISCKKDKELINEIYNEPAYAIGTINSMISIPLRVTYYYSFDINGQIYESKYVAVGIGQDNSQLIGKNYLVVYKISDPSKCDLNFDYYIEDEQDFLDLLIEFDTNPPKP
jgi:hypothetical protein